jgi:hypothetical protein
MSNVVDVLQLFLSLIAPYVRVIIILLAILGLWTALWRAGLLPKARLTGIVTTAVLLVWFVTTDQLGRAGFYAPHWQVMRPVGWAIALVWLIPLTRSQALGAALDAIPPWWLLGLQIYRTLGGLNWFVAWATGHLPNGFGLWAATGDVLVGVLAPIAMLYVYAGFRGWRTVGTAWNVLGILDFATAFIFGTITPYTLPYPTVMIPAFTAPLSLDFHFLSLRQLARAARRDSRMGLRLGDATAV